MLRRVARSMVARGLGWTGADRAIGRRSAVAQEPLVLGYHRVRRDGVATLPGVPRLDVSVRTLEKQLDCVGRRFRFVSLDELGARLEEGNASGLAAVTFDDGYVDFDESAFPLLQRKGIPAAVFVVTSLLEGAGGFLHERLYAALDAALRKWGVERTRVFLSERAWNAIDPAEGAFAALRSLLGSLDQGALTRLCVALENELGEIPTAPRSLNWEQLVRMSRAGLTIGSHTQTHTRLAGESADRVRYELEASRATLERKLGGRIAHFAYPDGSFDAAAVRAVAGAGYRFAYTGCRHRDSRHPHLTVPRRVLWEGSTLGAFGGFSAQVLNNQINGVFDFTHRCPGGHGVTRPPHVAVVTPSQIPIFHDREATDMYALTQREHWDSVHGAEDLGYAASLEVRAPRGLRRIVKRLLGKRFREYLSSYDDHHLWNLIYPRHIPARGAAVVEIGSAPGEHLVRLHETFGLVPYGIEYSPSGVAVNRAVFAARGIDPRNVIETDFFSDECLEAHRERFDMVISRGFIEHFESPAPVVNRHLELLKPGGLLIVTIPNLKGVNLALTRLFHRELIPMHNVEIMSKAAFARLFDPAKVRALTCRYFGTFNFYLFNVPRGSRLSACLAACMKVQPLLNALFRIGFGDRGAESRFTSPQLIFVGIKR